MSRTASIQRAANYAISLNRNMETAASDIYAAGDCAETWHHLLNNNTYLSLGTTSHKQGRIAGENAVGGNSESGVTGHIDCNIFVLVAARNGLYNAEALRVGYEPLTISQKA